MRSSFLAALFMVPMLLGAAPQQQVIVFGDGKGIEGATSAETLSLLGIPKADQSGTPATAKSAVVPRGPGMPQDMLGGSAFSAAVMTSLGGTNTQSNEVDLLGDWDGREDLTADHAGVIEDFTTTATLPNFQITRVAVSEHTIANGFPENIFYYGDCFGNLYVSASTALNSTPDVFTINLPTVLNAFGTLNSSSQIVITGLAVNPVSDLSAFPNVNGSFAPFNGLIGEVLYVSFWDTGSGLRLTGSGIPVRSGVLAFPIADVISPVTAPPGVVSPENYPVMVGGSFGVVFSVYGNLAGVAVDDDGSVYFQQVDLIQFTGANIVKITDTGSNQDRSAATSGFPTITTLNPLNGQYGTASGPASQVNTFTNYSGTATTFGNITALASGPSNCLYAAVARSLVSTDDPATQNTEGLFSNPPALGDTPSMVISFADCSGAFDQSSSPGAGIPGTIPVANGIADVAQFGQTLVPGVNNFRAFILGNGPDPRGSNPAVFPPPLLKIDMQVDYTINSGVMVDEARKVYLVSGGTPAGIGRNPSPNLGEILCFPDRCPSDRVADYTDLRGTTFPNPPNSGGNIGDGASTRFDFIFYQAPMSQMTVTPTGIAGLARGFLLYLNRTRTADKTPVLPNGVTQGDDDTTGPVVFELFDPTHQVAGGDDQNPPFRGDDADGLGDPALVGLLDGGFEFLFGPPTNSCVWNGFFLNSNGSVSFGAGDAANIPTVANFRSDMPKIAPAWTDLDPASRTSGFLNTFPVQAMGFAAINDFKVRWINVPQFGFETSSSLNTFSVSLMDDGTGLDENASVPATVEGPTDVLWTLEPNSGTLVFCPPVADGNAPFWYDYARMDLLGVPAEPVLTGYSIGGLSPTNPPGLCETNLSEASRASELDPFRTCLLGEGTEPTIYEMFDDGIPASISGGGIVTFATPSFDLRNEGNDPAMCTPLNQADPNRDNIGFYGATCTPPPAPLIELVTPVMPVPVPPGQPPVNASSTVGIINAICGVTLNILGCGFMPNEDTIVCQGDNTLQRPGKTVVTSATLSADTDGDTIIDLVIPLTNVVPISDNLVQATIPPLPSAPGTAFPFNFSGGQAIITVTTAFTAGDNNQFGPFVRTSTFTINVGTRAPVVLGVTPVTEECNVIQNLVISGASFILPGNISNVTSVFAVEKFNPANVVQANSFTVLSANQITAAFDFTGVNSNKQFLIFVSGPNGTSRNMITAPAPLPIGCPLGNEQGLLVQFACEGSDLPVCFTLGGTWVGCTQSCQTRRGVQTCTVRGNFNLSNLGTNRVPNTSIRFFASDDPVWDPSDLPLSARTVTNLRGGQTRAVSFQKQLARNTSISGKFILAVIHAEGDPDDCSPFNLTVPFGPMP